MAEEKRYPVRNVMPVLVAPGPVVRNEMPAPEARTVRQVGGAIRSTVGGAFDRAVDAVKMEAFKQSPITTMIASALGNQSARVAARDFVEGLMGIPADKPAKAAAKPQAAPVKQAVAAATAPAPAAPVMDPQTQMFRWLLNSPLTVSEARSVSEMSPAPKKPVSQKDLLVADNMAFSKEMYADAIKAATAAADPEERRVMTAKAWDDEFKRRMSIGGNNPMNMALAQMMGLPQLEDQ